MRISLLALIPVLLLCVLKNHAYWTAPGFEAGKTTFFWTESAMHYYLTDRAARGEQLSGIDKRAQFPEGVDLDHDFTEGMPYFVGHLYRLISPKMPLDVFIAYFAILFSSLTAIAVFLLARIVFSSNLEGFIAALFYAVSSATSARSVGAYLHEDFSLPLIIFSFYFFFSAASNKSGWRAAVSAALMCAALVSWHFTQFLLLGFAFSLWVSTFWSAPDKKTTYVYTAVLVALNLFSPLLRDTGVILSPAFALLFGLCAYSLLPKWKLVGALAVVAGAVLTYSFWGFGQQSHVFGIFFDKLRFGLMKPTDPKQLSFQTRALWIEDDNTADPFTIFYLTSFYIPLAALIWIGMFREQLKKPNPARIFALVISAECLVFFLMVRRMVTIEIIFLSLFLGGLILWGKSAKIRSALVALALVLIAGEGVKTWGLNRNGFFEREANSVFGTDKDPGFSTYGDQTDIVDWIKTQTQKDDVILGPIGFSPVILAMTGRPIVLHSKWESKLLREKFESFLTALFSSEARFLDFFTNTGAKFFIYDAKTELLTSRESQRYIADKLEPDKNSAAYFFHFHPEALQSFQLVYQNQSYRVFRLKQPGATPPLIGQPVYDEAYMSSRSLNQAVAQFDQAHEAMKMAISEINEDRLDDAEKTLLALKAADAGVLEIDAYLCYLNALRGKLDVAEKYCQSELKYRPYSVVGLFHSGLVRLLRGDREGAKRFYEAALQIDPRYEPAIQKLKEL